MYLCLIKALLIVTITKGALRLCSDIIAFPKCDLGLNLESDAISGLSSLPQVLAFSPRGYYTVSPGSLLC